MKTFKKIVITGAPSAGKSSVLAHLQTLALPKVALVKEAARVLLDAGFPIPTNQARIHAFQKAILSLQENLENSHDQSDITHMILDRGKPDGAGFWPPGIEDYLKIFKMNLEQEILKYDHVLFLELPTKGHFGGVDKSRFHNYEQSLETAEKLEKVWAKHPRVIRVPSQKSLELKIEATIQIIKKLLSEK